jgi:hypothetical protein
MELVASAVAKDDLDIFSLVHDDVLEGCGGCRKLCGCQKWLSARCGSRLETTSARNICSGR